MTVRINILKAEPVEAAFAKQFNMLRLPFQRKGTAYDFECPHTARRYELKHDKAATRTGNVFIETAYSNDGGTVWAESGFNLARQQAQFYVIRVGSEYIFLETPVLEQYLLDNKFRVAVTSTGANGNGPGVYARGLIVPVEKLKAVAFEIVGAEA